MIFSFVACGDTPAPTYTVTYVDGINDAEITVPSDTNQYHAGDTVTVKFTGIGSRTNYTFSGWSDGTTTYTSSGTTSFAMGTANVTLTAQWQWNYIGTKAPSVAKEVGDIVFSDGSATPYTANLTLTTAQQNAAIAIIFYKGTGLNSDVNGTPNNTTTRTLGVGLWQGGNAFVWCTDSANAHNVNIETIQCPASGSAGAYTFTGDKNGSDNLEQIAAFLTAAGNTTDDTTGEEAADRYPAFYFCKNYKNQTGSRVAGTDYETGWYLPSVAELFQIYANGKGTNKVFDIVAAYLLCGGGFFIFDYVSSSQYNNENLNKSFLDFSNGLVNGSSKSAGISENLLVCAIREF